MFAHREKAFKLFTGVGDGVVALAAFGLAYLLRASLDSLPELYPLRYYPWLVPLVVGLWLAVGFVLRTYREVGEASVERALVDPVKVFGLGTLVLFALTFALKLDYVSRLLLGLFAVFDLLLMVFLRLLLRKLGVRFTHWLAGSKHFLIVGNTPAAKQVGRILESGERLGAQLLGFAIPRGRDQPDKIHLLERSYPVYALEDIPQLLRRHVIDEVIFAVSKTELEELEETFLLCEEEGVKTRVLLTVFPHLTSHVYLDRLHGIPLLTFSTTPPSESLLLLKGGADAVMAAVSLVVLSPLLLGLALVVRLTSPGPIFYRQSRCGLGGRRFTLYKFRSMKTGADLIREELEALNEQEGPVFKIRVDPRCTQVGRLMRKFSLDELPQLWNILKGDMSFVGPRPPLPEEVQKYEGWQRRRLRMKPGLTCLWALEGRSQLSFRRWMELDLEYIDNWSPALDWKIILKTIPVVLSGQGAS